MSERKPAATLRDVAAAAQVDVSTVSRVLQNKGRVAQDTRARILQAAETLNYQSNPIARALKTARSSTLLMMVPQIENPIFASAIIGAEAEARALGYSLLVSYDQGNGPEVLAEISRSSLIEGVIVASFDEDGRLRSTLASSAGPYVILNRHLAGEINCVAIDTRQAARVGVDHLIDQGHQRIGHLAGRLGRFNGDMRQAGWRDALVAAGLPHGDELVAEAGYSPGRVPDAVDALVAQKVTAIHAATLLTAVAAIARIHELGLRVPEDISVVTMHDDLLARVVYPQVTTVALPSEEMGRLAVRRLLEMIQGDASDWDRPALLEPGELVSRASVAPHKDR